MKRTLKTLAITLTLILSSCVGYVYNTDDLKLATTLGTSAYLQVETQHRSEAIATINSATVVMDSFKDGLAPTPELFQSQLQAKLPNNETKTLFVTDLTAVYKRFYPSIPKSPVNWNASLVAIEVGLKDALVPFQGP